MPCSPHLYGGRLDSTVSRRGSRGRENERANVGDVPDAMEVGSRRLRDDLTVRGGKTPHAPPTRRLFSALQLKAGFVALRWELARCSVWEKENGHPSRRRVPVSG